MLSLWQAWSSQSMTGSDLANDERSKAAPHLSSELQLPDTRLKSGKSYLATATALNHLTRKSSYVYGWLEPPTQ